MSEGLGSFFTPSSIAVVGASDNPDSVGGRPLRYLRAYGYTGAIYPVNPKRSTVQGIAAYPAVDALSNAVDLAVIATPAAAVTEVVNQCARAGVKACVIFSSGFGELGAAGKDIEQELARISRQYGMRILGPNCQGVANLSTGNVACFSSCFGDYCIADGHIAVVTQSGAVGGMLAELQQAHPTGIRYWVSTGNESDVDVTQLIEWVLRDTSIRVVEVYCEQVKDPPRLAAAANKAAENGQAITMVKAATTKEGRKAAASHTGALAQEEEMVDAFLRQHSIIRAHSIGELSSLARVFTTGRRTGANRVAVVSNSGGLGVMMADRCRLRGLRVATLEQSTIKGLRSLLPSFAAVENPIDVTTQLLKEPTLLGGVLPTLARDQGVDLILVALGMVGKGYDVATIQKSLTKAYEATDRLAAVVWIGGADEAPGELSRAGIPTFSDDVSCIDAVARYVEYCTELAPGPGALSKPDNGGGPVPAIPLGVKLGSAGFMSEYASKDLMRRWGLPVVRGRLVHAPDEAVAAARDIGYPVVVKLSSPDLAHKTDVGAVQPDLRTDAEVAKAVRDVRVRGEEAGLTGVDVGILIEKMVTDGLEVAIGGIRNATFGPTILLASGGTDVAVSGDSQLCFPPLDPDTIQRVIRRLRIFPLLRRHRSLGPLDTAALVDLVRRFSSLLSGTQEIREVDLNPVFVRPEGRGVVIADALIGLEARTGGDDV